MNSQARTYKMDARRAAVEATRERILDAARQAFLDGWYDEVTIGGIAKDAGVSGQTVLNHFGDKESLLMTTAAERFDTEVRSVRWAGEPGDVGSVIGALLNDYEVTGDGVIRLLATEERVPAIRPLLAKGRAGHRQWVEEMFDRPDLVLELIVATDVYAWKLLRRDQGLTKAQTADSIGTTVRALLALPTKAEGADR
jgi:AcrR family transcriptional regulator